MSLASIQETYQKLAKSKYEELSNSSREEVINRSDLIEDFTFEYCTTYLKLPLKSIPSREYINEKSIEEQLKKATLGSLKVLNYCFADCESYTSPCSRILDLLTPDGIAVIYIPNRIFEKVKVDLEPDFFINGIFGFKDDRESIYDKEQVLPLDCKYIALWITKKKSEQLFVWTECDEFQFLEFDDDHIKKMALFHTIFSNGAERTPTELSYKALITGHPILYPRKELITLEHLYYKLENDSLSKLEFHNIQEKKLSDITNEYASEQFEVEMLLHCYSLKDDLFVFDEAKYKKAKKNRKSNKTDSHESPFYKELQKHWKENGRFSPRLYLDSVDDFIIVETVNYEYSPLSYKFYHPSEWNWSEFKQWQTSEKNEINICALKINTDIVLLDYLLHFLRSSYGDIQLKLALFNQHKHIIGVYEKGFLWKDITIPLPEIQDQKVISSALNKTKKMNDKIQTLETSLLTNPTKAEETESELSDMVNRLELISDSERILQLIKKRGRETKTVELKQTFYYDIETKTSNKVVQTSTMKVICSFLNTIGGILLIGVADNGEITGMNQEVNKLNKSSFDRFKTTFGQILGSRIGKEFENLIDYEFITMSAKNHVFEITCSPIPKGGNGCFLDGKDFYVRRNPYTEILKDKDLADYYVNRF